MRYLVVLVLACALPIEAFSSIGHGADPKLQRPVLILSAGSDSPPNIVDYVGVMKDNQNLPTSNAVNAIQEYHLLDKPALNIGFTTANVWLVMNVKNSSKTPGTWRMTTGVSNPNKLLIIEKTPTSHHILLSHEGSEGMVDRKIDHRTLLTDIELEPGEEKEIYLMISSDTGINLDIRFLTLSSFMAMEREDTLRIGVFLGFMLLLIIINLFQYIAAQKVVYVYYIILLASNIFLILQHEGYNFQYLWPSKPVANEVMMTLINAISASFTLLVFREVLNLRELSKPLNRIVLLIVFFWSLVIPSISVYSFQLGTGLFAMSIAPSILVLLPAGTYVAVKHKIKPAYLLLTGWFFYCGSMALYTLIHIGVGIPMFGIKSIALPTFGTLFESLFISMALAYKVLIIRRDRRRLEREKVIWLDQRITDMETLSGIEAEKIKAMEDKYQIALRLVSASHDVHQPLYAMRVALASLKKDIGDHESVDDLEISIDLATNILNSNIQASKAEVCDRYELSSLGHIFNELFRQNFKIAKDKNLILQFSPTTLYCKASRVILMRILGNLVKNALHYTKQGRVLCGVRRRSNGVEIQVFDTGVGIEESDIERLRNPFERGSNIDHTNNNFGLGIYVVQSLCQQQGYKFDIKSVVNKGSMFSVFIADNLVVKTQQNNE